MSGGFLGLTPICGISLVLGCRVEWLLLDIFQCHWLAGLSSEGHRGHLATAIPWPASAPIVPWDSKEKDLLNEVKAYPHKT